MKYLITVALLLVAVSCGADNWTDFQKDVDAGKYPKSYAGTEKCDNPLWKKCFWITNPGWDRCFNCGKTKPNKWKPIKKRILGNE